jgi:hypothetical protein
MTTTTALLILWASCQSLDLGTTITALQRPSYVETNPVLRGGRLIPIKVSVNVGMWIWRDKARERRLSRVGVPLVMAASGCVAGGLNLRRLR